MRTDLVAKNKFNRYDWVYANHAVPDQIQYNPLAQTEDWDNKQNYKIAVFQRPQVPKHTARCLKQFIIKRNLFLKKN